MNEIIIPDIPADDFTLDLGTHGMYVSKRTWLNAHRRLTIYFYEDGTAYKQDYKAID